MRKSLTLALALAAVLAVAGVGGYVVMAHGTALSGNGPAGPAAGSVGTLDVLANVTNPTNSTTPSNGTAVSGWKEVDVTFDLVQVHIADAGNASGWMNVSSVQRTVDLVSLKSVSALIGSTSLSAGNYTQLRIVVVSAHGVMANGTSVDFTVPSGDLRTADPFDLASGQTASLTITIDLSRSIVHAGNTWIFSPVLGTVQLS